MLKYFLTSLMIVAAVHSSIAVPVDADNEEFNKTNHGKVSSSKFTVLELPEIMESRNGFAPTGRPTRLIASNYPETWLGAINECLDMDTVLVSIGTSDIDTFVRNTLIRNQLIGQLLWTSGQNSPGTSEWVWAGTGKKIRYTNWNTFSDPYFYGSGYDYYSNTCIAIRANGVSEEQYKWETGNCAAELRFICAKY